MAAYYRIKQDHADAMKKVSQKTERTGYGEAMVKLTQIKNFMENCETEIELPAEIEQLVTNTAIEIQSEIISQS